MTSAESFCGHRKFMKKGVLVDPKLKYTGRQYRVKARLIGLVSCDSLVLKINELGNSSLASQGGA